MLSCITWRCVLYRNQERRKVDCVGKLPLFMFDLVEIVEQHMSAPIICYKYKDYYDIYFILVTT